MGRDQEPSIAVGHPPVMVGVSEQAARLSNELALSVQRVVGELEDERAKREAAEEKCRQLEATIGQIGGLAARAASALSEIEAIVSGASVELGVAIENPKELTVNLVDVSTNGSEPEAEKEPVENDIEPVESVAEKKTHAEILEESRARQAIFLREVLSHPDRMDKGVLEGPNLSKDLRDRCGMNVAEFSKTLRAIRKHGYAGVRIEPSKENISRKLVTGVVVNLRLVKQTIQSGVLPLLVEDSTEVTNELLTDHSIAHLPDGSVASSTDLPDWAKELLNKTLPSSAEEKLTADETIVDPESDGAKLVVITDEQLFVASENAIARDKDKLDVLYFDVMEAIQENPEAFTMTDRYLAATLDRDIRLNGFMTPGERFVVILKKAGIEARDEMSRNKVRSAVKQHLLSGDDDEKLLEQPKKMSKPGDRYTSSPTKAGEAHLRTLLEMIAEEQASKS